MNVHGKTASEINAIDRFVERQVAESHDRLKRTFLVISHELRGDTWWTNTDAGWQPTNLLEPIVTSR